MPRSPLLSVQARFWELVSAGLGPGDAGGVVVRVSAASGRLWFRQCGGVNPQLQQPPRGVKRPRLTHAEREQIMLGTASGESIRSIARRLGAGRHDGHA